MKFSSIWSDFKNFAFKGNMIDLAVAVILGAAFGQVINSMVKNILMPLISYVTPHMDYSQWHIGRVLIGNFINDFINFIIIAIAIFIAVVKMVGLIMKKTAPPAPGEPTTKECPHCLETIPYKARKCGHCTSDLGGDGPLASDNQLATA